MNLKISASQAQQFAQVILASEIKKFIAEHAEEYAEFVKKITADGR